MDELLKEYVNKQEYDYYNIPELEQKLDLLSKTNELKTKELEHDTKIKELDQKYQNIIQKLKSEFYFKIQKYDKEFNIISEKYEQCSKKLTTQSNLNEIKHVFTVYSKEIIKDDIINYVFLKKAFKQKELAYEYTVSKITSLLNSINDEFKTKKEYYYILPIGAQTIYMSYNKLNNNIDKYNYYKENYIQFFRYVLKTPVMFCVSEHNLI